MKNKFLLVTTLLTVTLLFGVISNTARAGVSDWSWLGYAYSGTDSFHRASVVAYEANTTATLSVTIDNNYFSDKQLNISALKVGFDWGQNYTSTMTSMANPFIIPWGETRVIPIIFKVPTLTVVSNQAMYSYTIYLEYINSTTEPKKVTSLKQGVGNNFVVYSTDQVESQQTMLTIGNMKTLVGTDPKKYFNSTSALLFWTKSQNETYVAGMLYSRGDFAGAKTHYQAALSLINQALAAEDAKGGGFDDAYVKLLEAQAKSYEGSANYLNGLSSMWVLIGVGVVLFAIGYIIRGFAALRKPVPPP